MKRGSKIVIVVAFTVAVVLYTVPIALYLR
jgi:hypothetical protein